MLYIECIVINQSSTARQRQPGTRGKQGDPQGPERTARRTKDHKGTPEAEGEGREREREKRERRERREKRERERSNSEAEAKGGERNGERKNEADSGGATSPPQRKEEQENRGCPFEVSQ